MSHCSCSNASCATCFKTFINKLGSCFLTQGPFQSSTGHRNGQRLNAAAAIIKSTVQTTLPASYAPIVVIPTSFVQFLDSLYTMFRNDVKNSERAIHGLQATFSLINCGAGITLFFQHGSCDANATGTLCNLIVLMTVLYSATLLSTWITSEASKAPYIPANAINKNGINNAPENHQPPVHPAIVSVENNGIFHRPSQLERGENQKTTEMEEHKSPTNT